MTAKNYNIKLHVSIIGAKTMPSFSTLCKLHHKKLLYYPTMLQ